MKLRKVLKGIKVLNAKEIKNVTIENISNKTDDVLENGLYVCLNGGNVDGHNLKQQAKEKGAIAFLVEKYDYEFDGLQILVKDTRVALAIVAKNFYSPKTPKIIGVTGTNGKTTTTCLVAHILKTAGKKVGVIGTEGVVFDNKKICFHMTTPDPIELCKVLGEMYRNGIEFAVMEVSAHAIYLKKIFSLKFCVKALTNITEDHLDFFKTFDNYQKTKSDFIVEGKCAKIVNIDDKYGCNIANNNSNIVTYSLVFPADAGMVKRIDANSFNATICGTEFNVQTKLIGDYNIQNILCAILICYKLKIKMADILKAIKTFESVEGRLNVYKRDNITAVIDFAHTPDALDKVLTTLKKVTTGKLYCLFGCGGNRDSEKRYHMGKIASELSDFVFVTSDNPRFEEPEFIAKQIVAGIKNNNYEVIIDRELAITKAVEKLKDGDVLAVCGKGAEDYLDVKGVKIPYSDKKVLESLNFVKH